MTSRTSPKVTHLENTAKRSSEDGIDLTLQFAPDKKPVEISARTGKPKRRKAVRACTNCQRTHLTCDDDRPCERCVKRGCADTCVDGERKKPRRSRNKSGDGPNKTDLSQFLPDMLMGQSHLELPELPHLHQYNGGVDQHALYSQMSNAMTNHHRPKQGPLPQDPQFQAHQHFHLHLSQHASAVANGYSELNPHLHPGPDQDAEKQHMQHMPAQPIPPHAGRRPPLSNSVESYGILPDYFEPLDLYAFPSQPPLHRFTSEIQGTHFTTKDGSVISAMLQRNGNAEDNEDTIIELPPVSEPDARSAVTETPNQEEPSVPLRRDHQSILPWLQPPTNPLVTAHNESSRRFSYNYEHTDPSEVYRKVTEAYPNRKAFYQMVDYLKRRMESAEFKRIVGHLNKLKTQFASITRPLSNDDNLFVEQSFQRSLLEEEKQFALIPVPCLVWRRSGIVAAVSPRFTKLTQWNADQLKGEFIMKAINDESISRYFEKFQPAVCKPSSDFKFECVLLTPTGEEITTEAEVFVRKDLFNMPLTIVGKFWVKS